MRITGSTMVIAAIFSAVACTQSPRPGRCEKNSDCMGGQICDLDPTPQGNGRCVTVALSDGGADSSDGGLDAQSCSACAGSTSACVRGACVECATSADCLSDTTKPICDASTNSCVACSSDDQCVAKLGANPGVCMSHQDGRCATDAETIYVQNLAGCTATFVNEQGGTATVPYCSMEPALASVADSRAVVVVRGTVNASTLIFQRSATSPETSIIGQQSATIASGAQPGLNIQSGAVYVRGVTLSSSASTGINAVSGNPGLVALRLDTVTVNNCQQGGVLLDGATFDIRNTTVTNNGPGQQGAISWGGILVNSLPASGSTQLSLVTIENNKAPGMECADPITGIGVFATGNSTADIGSTCGVSSCSPMSATCGASP
jgi:hypothetical protein